MMPIIGRKKMNGPADKYSSFVEKKHRLDLLRNSGVCRSGRCGGTPVRVSPEFLFLPFSSEVIDLRILKKYR